TLFRSEKYAKIYQEREKKVVEYYKRILGGSPKAEFDEKAVSAAFKRKTGMSAETIYRVAGIASQVLGQARYINVDGHRFLAKNTAQGDISLYRFERVIASGRSGTVSKVRDLATG